MTWHFVGTAFLTALFCLGAPAWAQTDPAAPQESDLQAVERDLEREREAQADAERRAAETAKEAADLQFRMVDAAQRIQDREYALDKLETDLAQLERDMERMAVELGDKDEQMRDVLLALERLAVRPTDALMLQPLRPADAVRSGLVLSAAVPALTNTAAQLQTELDEMYQTRAEIITQRQEIAATAAALLEERTILHTLFLEKSEQQEQFKQAAAEANARVNDLAKEAGDLRELLEKVIAERARQAREAEEKRKQEAVTLTPPDATSPTPEIVTARRPAPPEPERSFSEARGTLPFPAVGRMTQRYGEADADGILSKGITISTRPDSPVISPFDGVVAFAGQFRGYGLLLILEHSEGYHTLLAGMSRLDGVVGQRVLAGEPVGVMAPESDPSLYVELRRDGQPINPLPWLAARTNENSG